MATVTEIISFLDELLAIEQFQDYGPNGLQVPGKPEIRRVVTGVSAHLELFELAAEHNADLVLTHHGILWDFHPRRITPQLANRLRVLLQDNINLASYHLPLDAHLQYGNNALIASALGCSQWTPFGQHRGQAVGVVGEFAEPIPAEQLIKRVTDCTSREPLVFPAGPAQVRTVAIVSGAAASSLSEATAQGVDAFITGEPAEHVMADAHEGKIHFIAAGHYATETFGIKAIGELLAARFDVAHEFLAIPNPI